MRAGAPKVGRQGRPVATRSGTWALGHQPALQGVRAVAVLAVYALHIGEARGGWLGVEIFFVLSGFLITTLLLREQGEGRVRIGRFYVRRVARLIPAVLVMLTVTTAFWVLVPRGPAAPWSSVGASLFYYANWAELFGVDMRWLSHMWSLSIEEQFYFVWPLVLVLVGTRAGARGVALLALIGFVASVCVRAALVVGRDDWYVHVYYASDTRAAALLVGCLAGALLFLSAGSLSRRIPPIAVYLLAGLLAASLLLLPGGASCTWLLAVSALDVGIAVVLVALVGGGSALSKALAWRPLTYVGELSYSLYLWHVPVIQGAQRLLDGPERYVVQLVVPFVLAAASYHLIERPARRFIVHWAGR